ncbi:MAG: 50S ribosomal protein L29 [Candidatus Schekmanbacteria bacterium RBG_13_48_7]|uniref:Large ribosomal subunit protein uL29 n=1 Tax=Candidatus Schekmanbacteria bacterium RBG_13_48_7 TaxID=1817878 RepID=A0A1F7S1M7_9BACT|nr:MAG: 50S ribosomal protein L29 [Candidatus Schekmanbacteria bacterium RBG_13_48_7]
MKISALREMALEEMLQKKEELTEELFNLRFQASTGQIENPIKMRSVRRDIARIATLLRELEINQPADAKKIEETKSNESGQD